MSGAVVIGIEESELSDRRGARSTRSEVLAVGPASESGPVVGEPYKPPERDENET